MKTKRIQGWMGILGIACCTMGFGTALAQTFSSGSTGTDGAYAPSCAPTPCTVTEPLPLSGVFNYTTVTIPAGVTVRYTRNAANTPVTMLATGDVTVAGTINLNGDSGATTGASSTFNLGGSGGPGGFDGGNGGLSTGHPNFPGTVSAGSAGKGPNGGNSATTGTGGSGGSFASGSFVSLVPLFGGSGGGGGLGFTGSGYIGSGASGGGGAGAIVIASSTKITVTGSVTARGGGASNPTNNCGQGAGAGSGGAIRLVAPEITGTGSLNATEGDVIGCSGPAASGRIRLEAFTLGFTGTRTPSGQLSTSPGPVTASSNPSLVNLPTLAITSVGGVAAPAVPGGSFNTADVSLTQGTANPAPVVVTATNTPVGTPTAITLRLIPPSGLATTVAVPAASQTGSFASSTASADITFPVGQVSLVQAHATMTLTGQIASLFPLIDGEPVDRVQVAATQGEPSTLSLVTKSGKEVRVDRLPFEDQIRVAQAWEVLRATRVE